MLSTLCTESHEPQKDYFSYMLPSTDFGIEFYIFQEINDF